MVNLVMNSQSLLRFFTRWATPGLIVALTACGGGGGGGGSTTTSPSNPASYTVSAVAGAGSTISPASLTVASGQTASFTVGLLPGYSNLVVTGGGGTLSGTTYTTGPITANTTVTASATATPTTYTVTAVAGAGTTITPATLTVTSGQTASFTVGLLSGYSNLVVTGGGGTLSGTTYTTGPITANTTVTASATAIPTHTVSITLGNGAHTPSTSLTVNDGGSVTIPFTLDAGYTNLVVTGGTGTLSGLSYTLTNVTSDVSLNAAASVQMFTITATAGNGGSVGLAAVHIDALEKTYTASVPYGTQLNLYIQPDDVHVIDVCSGISGVLNGNTFTTDPITADGNLSISFKAKYGSQYALQGIHMTPNAVFFDEFTNIPITVEATVLGTGFNLFVEYSMNEFDNTLSGTVQIPLVDDGTGSDRVAGDGIYTATFVPAMNPALRYYGNLVDSLQVRVVARDASSNVISAANPIQAFMNLGIVARSSQVATTPVSAGVVATQHMVNVVLPGFQDSPTAFTKIMKNLYTLYPDSFDTATFFTFGTTTGANNPACVPPKNVVQGIGRPLWDESADWGSGGTLYTVMSLCNDITGLTFLHEFGHTFMFSLSDPALNLTDSSGVHVGSPTTLIGQMGNGNYLKVQPSGDYLVTNRPDGGMFSGNKYADMELYLMGLLDPSVVTPERFVLDPAVNVSFNSIIPASSTNLVTANDIISVYGPRTPDVTASQKNFQALFIGVSENPMSPAEIALLDTVATFYASGAAGRDQLVPGDTRLYTPPSFASATKYLATMSTIVPPHK